MMREGGGGVTCKLNVTDELTIRAGLELKTPAEGAVAC